MTEILAALAPIFLLILAGFAVRRTGLVDDGFWAPAERLVYFGLFPALLLSHMATADLSGHDVVPMFAALAIGVVAVSLSLLAVRRRLGVDGPAFTSVLQGGIRPNTYVGLAAAAGLYGETGLALAAVGIAGLTPLVNLVSVSALAHYGRGAGGPGFKQLGRALVTNPIILSVSMGGALNLAGLALPPVVGPVLEIAGAAALPLSLLAVGAGLDAGAFGRTGLRPVVVASVAKFLLLPAVVWALAATLGADGLELEVAVMFAALPSATSGYILARQMGGDTALIARIITLQTVAAALSLPAVLMLLG